MTDKLMKIVEKMAEDKKVKDTVKKKLADKGKVKALTQAERLDRIEELLGLK